MVASSVRMISALALGGLTFALCEPAPVANDAQACEGPDDDSAMLQTHSKSTPLPLTKAQLIGFSIYTFPENFLRHRAAMQALSKFGQYQAELEELGVKVQVTVPEDYYAGDDDPEQDVHLRFALMKNAIETARAKADYDPSPSTLKIFMAPEFFFRGTRGAYRASTLYGCDGANKSSKCKPTLNTLLTQMQEFVSEDRWSDWLFVLGTIVASESSKGLALDAGSPPLKDTQTDTLFYNVAPVLRGGPNGERFLVPKTYISGIDFLECMADEGCVKKPHATEYTGMPPAAEAFLKNMGFVTVRDNIFKIQGVVFGVEICLDHAHGVLYSKLKEQGLLHGAGVQVHLITSAGMSIEYGITPFNGPEFLQDGGVSAKTETGTNQRLVQPEITLSLDKTFSQIFSTENVVPRLRVYAPVPIPDSPRFTSPS